MTITLTREEAQQVLDAFLGIGQRAYDAMSGDAFHECSIAVSRLRFRLSALEPPCKTGSQCIGGKCPQCVVSEPEPVAWMQNDMEHFSFWPDEWHVVPLYTAPLQRKEWHGLTDEEIEDLFMENMYCDNLVDFEHIARAIEAKLKEKNTS